MFEIGWSEILVIAVVAIVVIGPKDLPRVLRTVGQWTGRLKRMSREFQNQFNEAIRESELESVHRDIVEIGKIDPMADIRAAAAKTGEEIRRDLDGSPMPSVVPPPTPGTAPVAEAVATAVPPPSPTVFPEPATAPDAAVFAEPVVEPKP